MQLSFLMPIIRTEVARMEVTPEEILLVDRMGKRYVRATRKEFQTQRKERVVGKGIGHSFAGERQNRVVRLF